MEEAFWQMAGIDFGSKLAGTTVIAFPDGRQPEIRFAQSKKNADADQFIQEWVARRQPAAIFLDAPLSLPGVYRGLAGYDDYFYRQADRQLKAMSPMFLGGLTARAMRLKHFFEEQSVAVREVYPGALSKVLGVAELGYKKEKAALRDVAEIIAHHLPCPVDGEVFASWHHVDALLALLSGWRFLRGSHRTFGDPGEGVIII